ncbi:TPA: hypothetical protein PFR81_002006 [Clostridioides difficile]|uniref:hypothetical protein n=1 Tax=Clostridioides difficile TaxID=1496 RepID=UPI001B8B9BEF|nr:hypothetical protein [Clostridioides difficile]MBS1296821.1 hypothetical protein [Clostridioides difficile]HDG7527511.1 hypothetical protein [Clostridioides difficile]
MEKEITIKIKMEERWINDFCSMLKMMENLGNVGSSKIVGIYSDGDGDFRPKFEIDTDFEKVHPKTNKIDMKIYDAE